MKFSPTTLADAWLIELELRKDERGFLARTFCEKEFAALGLNTHWPQCNLTLTKKRGAIRGMHFQAEPKPEIKLIRCAAGKIFDVIVDVRRDSPTFPVYAVTAPKPARNMAMERCSRPAGPHLSAALSSK